MRRYELVELSWYVMTNLANTSLWCHKCPTLIRNTSRQDSIMCTCSVCLLYAYLLDTTFSVCHFTWIYMYSSSILFTTRFDGLSLVSSYCSLVHHGLLLSCMHDIFIILICFNQCETIASYIVRCSKIEKLWSNRSNFKCQLLYVRYR